MEIFLLLLLKDIFKKDDQRKTSDSPNGNIKTMKQRKYVWKYRQLYLKL